MSARSPLALVRARPDARWLLLVVGLAALFLLLRGLPRSIPEPPLQLVALGSDGTFQDTLVVPRDRVDTATTVGGAVRIPLVLAVRNTGERPARPGALSLSLPVSYRLVSRQPMDPRLQAGSPLVTYTIDPELPPVEPGRMPALLPRLDTVWLEVLIPSLHCVMLADSVPEFIAAPAPPLRTLADVRIFYSFEGGDLSDRRTGTLAVRLDTTVLALDRPDPPPSFPVVQDSTLATPATGPLRNAGTRSSTCGDAQDPVTLESTLWRTPAGGIVVDLRHNGVLRKRLYDLDDDGVVERESWDADGDGIFEATREARLPIPEAVIPVGTGTPGGAADGPGPG